MGIVNPTEEEKGRHNQGILQKVIVELPDKIAPKENVGHLLALIGNAKEYLGEPYIESRYRELPPNELKREYFRLFERIMFVAGKRSEALGSHLGRVP